jgi:tetratricopeptide (TPR) repeat protein
VKLGSLLISLGASAFALAPSGGPAWAAGDEPASSPPAAVSTEAPASAEADLHAAAVAALAEGNQLFKRGDFAGALTAYRRAQAIYPASAAKVEFNVGKAQEALKHHAAAADAFDRFLSVSPAAPSPEYCDEASAALARVSASLGKLRLTAPRDGLAIRIDGDARGATPLERPLWLAAGHHAVALQDGDRVVFRREFDVQVGAIAEVAMAAEPAPERAPRIAEVTPASTEARIDLRHDAGEPKDHPPVWRKWWFWTGAGAAVAAGVVTTLLLSRGSEGSCTAGFTCVRVMPPPK